MVDFIFPVSVTLYIGLSLWMLVRGWPIRAGISMIFTALSPWFIWLTSIEGRLGAGAGIAMMITAAMLLLALVPIGIGLCLAVAKLCQFKEKQID
jgi:hypothetical protein